MLHKRLFYSFSLFKCLKSCRLVIKGEGVDFADFVSRGWFTGIQGLKLFSLCMDDLFFKCVGC